MANSNAHTIKGLGLLRELKSDVKVATPILPPETIPSATTGKMVGIWDTGATGSVITQRVVDELGISPVGIVLVHTAGGSKYCPQYYVEFILPMGVTFKGLTVTLGELPPGADVLIGMDIIVQGDFAITHRAARTTMSFRVPSSTHIDYVEEIKSQGETAGMSRSERREFQRKQDKQARRR